MEINLENSRSLLVFLIPTIIITIVLFIVEEAAISLIVGFIVLIAGAVAIYYLGLNYAEKNTRINYAILILFIIVAFTIANFLFLIDEPGIITIIGLAVLFTMYSFSWHSGIKKAI